MIYLDKLKTEMTFIYVFIFIGLAGSLATHFAVMSDVSNLVKVELQKFVERGLGDTAFNYGDSQIEYVEPISDFLIKSNVLMNNVVPNSTFSLLNNTMIQLDTIDLVQNPEIIHQTDWYEFKTFSSFLINKNNKPRKVVFSITTTPKFGFHSVIWLFMFVSMRYIWKITPTPYSHYQNTWRKVILDSDRTGSDLDDNEIDSVINQFPLTDPFGEHRLSLFTILNSERKITVKEAINELMQPQLNQLNESGWHWLFVALKHNKNLDEAIEIALLEDKVSIDVRSNVLYFRGLDIDLTGTPLAYYGWYLLHRMNTKEGWVSTPDSNNNYPELQQDLANLFDEWTVHSRGSMFNEDGASLANRLKGNRNRIKTAIEEELGGHIDIAAPYLFETRKMAFRIPLKPENITIL